MERSINVYLNQWVKSSPRKPLLLRGARQVGKTFAARELGKQFKHFVEISFEIERECQSVFDKNLKPDRIIRDLSLIIGKSIIPGETLLFMDEIQEVPLAVTALRYFYEKMPELAVIAAGSLLDFALEKVGMPVGRVDSLYMYPLSWLEFLRVQNKDMLASAIFDYSPNNPPSDVVHEELLKLLGEYCAIGGMPEVVQEWVNTQDYHRCFRIQQSLLEAYRQDFEKYSKKHQIKYVELLFDQVPRQMSKRFKFSDVPGEYRKRELQPCLDLLNKAGVVHIVNHASAQGLPLGAEVDLNKFKAIFLDVGLAQVSLGLDVKEWFLNSPQAFINAGNLNEALIGQELLAYSNPFQKQNLYYWHKESSNSQAEVDYILQIKGDIIPIEVKSGTMGHLKSLREFLKTHPKTQYAVRFSKHNYSKYENLYSYPLYAVAKLLKPGFVHAE